MQTINLRLSQIVTAKTVFITADDFALTNFFDNHKLIDRIFAVQSCQTAPLNCAYDFLRNGNSEYFKNVKGTVLLWALQSFAKVLINLAFI
jgi:hypothetical protein